VWIDEINGTSQLAIVSYELVDALNWLPHLLKEGETVTDEQLEWVEEAVKNLRE
jgi:hypothetical protein